jgi:hypothetical protein
MDEDRPAEDDAEETGETEEPEAAEPEATEETEPEEPEETESSEAGEGEQAEETEPSEAAERPASAPDAGGISPTTTTGDPDKDVGGPSVTEESRRTMEGDEALEEPGYGDLGHAEDLRILRDD